MHESGPESQERQSTPQLWQLSPEIYSFEAQEMQIDSASSKPVGQVEHLSIPEQVAQVSPHY